ncbi:translocation/assembly module TamB domain-containing protein [Ideonella sp.]|uniref:translocation/assembly module TamB domain-containing protein n=1 Tax=Ideonella sp. TaxID=1929293 RepID=UPI002B47AEC8|nr:translocation/assembly module TamB domain-containing protein [Ideonella sp.]HJV69041.1 translocation/assembly module TamB domain-containing protein [Ideonella sp.]
MNNAPAPPQAAPLPRAERRRLRQLAWELLALVVVLVGALVAGGAWLARSEGGGAWLLGQVPGLRVEGLRGALLGDELTAERLRYEIDGNVLELQRVRLAGLVGDWTTRPRAREPWLQLHLDALSAEAATWRSGPPGPSPTPTAPPTDLRLPFSLTVDRLAIGRLQVDELPALAEVRAKAAFGDDRGARHRLTGLRFHSARWLAEADVTLGTDAPLALDLRSRLRSADGAARPWQATLDADGPLARLQARAHLAGSGAKPPALDATAAIEPFAPWPLAALDLRTEALDLAALHADAPQTRLRGQAHVRTTGLRAPAEVDATLDNDAPGRWDEGKLPLRRLHLVAQGQPQALGELSLQTLVLDLGGSAPGGQLQGRGELKPADGAERLTLQLTLEGLRPATLDKRLPAMVLSGPLTLDLHGLPAFAEATTPGTPTPTTSTTPATPSDPLDNWQARLTGQLEGRLEPTGGKKAAAARPAVQLAWQAELDRRHLTLNESLARAGSASARLKGRLDFGGSGNGAPWAWQAQGELADFDPLVWWPGPAPGARRGPNRLNAVFDSEGRWQPGTRGTGLLASLDGLNGKLGLTLRPSQWAGLPLQGEVNATRDKAGTGNAQARIELAGNRLTASGQDGGPAARSAELAIDAPALQALAPWLASLDKNDPLVWLPRAGKLQASAGARWPGAPDAPQWQGQLHASALVNPAWHADRLDAQAQGSGLGEGALNATLAGEGLAWRVAQVQSVRAELKGSLREHQASLVLHSPARPPAWAEQLLGARTGSGTRLQFAASGRWQPAAPGGGPFDAGRWQGRLQELQGRASDGSGQPWLAGQDIGLALAWDDSGRLLDAQAEPGRIVLPGTALRWSEAHYQADARRPDAPGEIALTAQLEAFELAPLLARAQPELGWRGDLVLAGDIRLRANERVDADIVFERVRGDLSVADDVRDTATAHRALGLSDLRVALSAHDGTWHFTAGLAGRQLGEMAGVATVRTTPQARWPAPEAPLDGTFQLHVAQLGAWGGWVPPGWRLGGDLLSAATLNGRWGAPELSGRLTGRQLEVRNGLQGVQLSDGTVDIAFNGDSARIERFAWRGGDGTLTMSGEAALGRDAHAELKLQAERLRLLGRLDRRLVATGQATLSLAPRSAKLAGALRIDEGLIDVSRGDAPTLDEDVRIVGRAPTTPTPGEPAAAPANGRDFETRLEMALDLGPALHVKGRGLDTYLRGSLQLANPGNHLALRGDVRAERGTYAAYGQKLEIERGLLSFTGPVEDPRLDILAVRPNLDMQVGVAVTGSALNPRVRLYSDPDMSDTDKLSWLVLGRASDGLGRADSALLQRAAIALLAGEGEAPTDAFLANIGLSDFGVRQTGEGTEATTVVSLGKQLSRRWYVGYERSINATTGTWQLIYRIAQRFTLRAQSGTDSALDLIWSWRWD